MKLSYEELEAKCAALAAENAGLKDLARGWANATDDQLFEVYGVVFNDSIIACEVELKAICPATDAFLAEVRAQGVEMLAAEYESKIEPYKNHDEFMNAHYLKMQANEARQFAAQLRKGVQS